MGKSYVLDTNVLMEDPDALFHFKEHTVIIPIEVLRELDKHKNRQDLVGVNTRKAIRHLDDFRQLGQLSEGVTLPEGGGKLKVSAAQEGFSTLDEAILNVAVSTRSDLITNDIHLRVMAGVRGVDASAYEWNGHKKAQEVYSGAARVYVEPETIAELYKSSAVELPAEATEGLSPNQFLIMKNGVQGSSAIARYKDGEAHVLRVDSNTDVSGLRPRNKEQQFALDLLLDQNVPLVTLIGKAGCGKSLMAVAAGLYQVLETGQYDKIIVSRPVIPLGKDLGFLPGPQPLEAPVLTPQGWSTMGEMKEGTLVISQNGHPTEVVGVFPKGVKPVYRIRTADGATVECCDDHLWLTQTAEERKRGKEGSVRSAKQIRETLLNAKGKPNHFLPRVEPVRFNQRKLPIPPYLLGALLGDGSLGSAVHLASKDPDIVERCQTEANQIGCEMSHQGGILYYFKAKEALYNNKPADGVRVTNLSLGLAEEFPSLGIAVKASNVNRSTFQSRCREQVEIEGKRYEFIPRTHRWQNPLKEELEKLSLLGTKSWNNFIPSEYLYSSVEDRLALLQGLMDTDGCVKVTNGYSCCSYTTTSKALALGVQELVRSLGGRALLKTRDRVGKKSQLKDGRILQSRRISYEFTVSLPPEINPFHLKRKAEKFNPKYLVGNAILSVEPVGEKEVQCIRVKDESHLYVTSGYTVTHNSLEEKMGPWIQPIKDSLHFLLGKNKQTIEMQFEDGTIEIEALTYIRGRSIPNCYVIIDEAQNLSVPEMKAIITRIGEGSKIVVTGDIEQVDSHRFDSHTNGLAYLVEKMMDQDVAGHITLLKGERSRLATIAADIL